VEAYVRQDLDAEISRRIIEGYRLQPQGEPDDWGDPGALADHAARETHQRLDAEEREAGLQPW